MHTTTTAGVTEELLRRIYGEFVEMPGMHLTSRQAQRLWGLDEKTCAEAMGVLVKAKFLWLSSDGSYRRLTEGLTGFPPVSMLKAGTLPARRARAH